VKKKWCLLFAATVFALLLGEAAMRLVALGTWMATVRAENRSEADGGQEATLRELIQPSDNNSLVYSLKPRFESHFRGVSVRTNSLGLRDREIHSRKAPDEFRILGLGDSVMFGWGVEVHDSYLRRVETELNESYQHGFVTTVNCGVPGYNTVMEVEQYEKLGSKLDPDLVILHLINNDLQPPQFLSTRPRLFSLRHSALLAAIMDGRLPRPMGTLVNPGEIEGFDDRRHRDIASEYIHLTGEVAFNAALDRLQLLTKGIPVLCLILTRNSPPWKYFAEAVERRGFLVVETAPLYSARLAQIVDRPNDEAWKATFWLSESDPHPNAFGHELLAQTVVDAIRENRLLD
jgi:lysophospholipase L1-like esterase